MRLNSYPRDRVTGVPCGSDHMLVGGLHRIGIAEVHPDPARLGLVEEARSIDLHHHRVAEGVGGPRRFGRGGDRRPIDQRQAPVLDASLQRRHPGLRLPGAEPGQAGERQDRRPRLLGHRGSAFAQRPQACGRLTPGHPQMKNDGVGLQRQKRSGARFAVRGRVRGGNREHDVVVA